MRFLSSIIITAIFLTHGFITKLQAAPIQKSRTESLQQSRSVFVENGGQVVDEKGASRPEILFTLRDGGTRVFVSANSIHYQFEKLDVPVGYQHGASMLAGLQKKVPGEAEVKRTTHRMTLSLKGANPRAKVIREDPQAYTENYYLAHSSQGITGLHSYSRIVVKDVYAGIDWVLYSSAEKGSGITYDFIVHPGADPDKIRLEISDADAVTITENGELHLKNRLGIVKEKAPVSFSGGKEISTRFVSTNEGVGFALGEYDHRKDLRIDPSVVWATYFGGTSSDYCTSVATDTAGSVFITGYTSSTSQLAVSGFQTNFGGGQTDGFVAKLDTAGQLLWATYFGGSGDDYANSCATDLNGNVYCTGATNSNGLASLGAFQTTCFDIDAFLIKLNGSGARQWCTYFGGGNTAPNGNKGADIAASCAVDPSGNIYITGHGNASGLGFNGFQNSLTTPFAYDAFLVKFSPGGARVWSTYMGGSDVEEARSCATDFNGNVYICGVTMSTTNIASPGAFMTTPYAASSPPNSQSGEAFLVKYDATGNRLWGTYYGDRGNEESYACTTDPFGNVFLLGTTSSASGIATNGTHLSSFISNGYPNSFIAKFNSAGRRSWGTYYAGNTWVYGHSICADQSGNIYFAGETRASTGVAFNGIKNSFAGNQDAFIVKMDSTGNRRWGSYYGGGNLESLGACTIDRFGHVYLSGITSSTQDIEVNGFQDTLNGSVDAFLVKIADTVPIIRTDTLPNTVLCAGDTLKVGFHSFGIFYSGNVYSAQLSSQTGSFLTPTVIGTLKATTNIDTVIAVIPKSTPAGTSYRIRVVGSMPQTFGKDNGYDITIQTGPQQPGAISGNDTACTGSKQLYRTTPVPGATSYSWTLPSGWTGSSTADTILATAGSSGGTITVVAMNTCGQSLPRTRSVVAGNFFVTPTVQIPRRVRCSGKSNVFTAATTYAGSNPVFQWMKNGTNVGSNSGTYVDTSLKTGDIIQVVMTSNAPCVTQVVVASNNDTIIVGVTTRPGININSNPPIVLCDGAPIRFITNIVDGGITPGYQWYKNGILIPGATRPTYLDSLLVNGDTLTVMLYSSDACPITQPTQSNHVGVTVYPNLPPSVSIAASPDSIVTGYPVSFTATPVNGGPHPTYIWYLNGVPQQIDTLNYWSSSSLIDGDEITVRLNSTVPCPVPLTVLSAPLRMRAYTTGLQTMKSRSGSIKLYPNPVSSVVTVELTGTSAAGRLTLSDALGREVYSAIVINSKNQYDLSHLPAGVYSYRVSLKNGELVTGKLVRL